MPFPFTPISLTPNKAIDMQSAALGALGTGVLVQDTDLSYRPRVSYTRWREEGSGWWQVGWYGYVDCGVQRED